MPDHQAALITAVGAALTEHAQMHGSWVLVYEEQRLDVDGEPESAVSEVGDGLPLTRLGMLTVSHHRAVTEAAEEDER